MTTHASFATVAQVAGELLGQAVIGGEPISGGGNSQVFKLALEDGSLCAAKKYFGLAMNGADRLLAETNALHFLREQGEFAVPRSLAGSSEEQVAIFEFIDGERITAVNDGEIGQFTSFLLRLEKLSSAAADASLPDAVEASLSPYSLVQQIERRLERFNAIEIDSPQQQALRVFLDTEFVYAFERIHSEAEEGARRDGIEFSAPRPRAELVLSPSDAGFHNALRQFDGTLLFLDFEYFGWDDPAKMIIDVLLHPGMNMTLEQKQLFTDTMVEALAPQRPHLKKRIANLFPLVNLKWITILLNEFVRSDWDRRRFAAGFGSDTEKDEKRLLTRQLKRAKAMMSDLCDKTGPLWKMCFYD